MGSAGVTQSPSKTAQSPGKNFLQWCLLPFLVFDEGWVLIFDSCSVEIKKKEIRMGFYRQKQEVLGQAEDRKVFHAFEIFMKKKRRLESLI